MIENYKEEELKLKEKFESYILEKYREHFQIPKPVEEFIYEEYFIEFTHLYLRTVMDGGGGCCSCGRSFMGPITIPIALYTKNYPFERDRILENSFYTRKCENCGKQVRFASPIYIDIDRKKIIAMEIDNYKILQKAGYKFYQVKYDRGGLEGYIKMINQIEKKNLFQKILEYLNKNKSQ